MLISETIHITRETRLKYFVTIEDKDTQQCISIHKSAAFKECKPGQDIKESAIDLAYEIYQEKIKSKMEKRYIQSVKKTAASFGHEILVGSKTREKGLHNVWRYTQGKDVYEETIIRN